MTAQTKLSAKGQIVIPKDVRDRLGWPQGSEIEIVETSGGVLLRKKQGRKQLTIDEALAKIHAIAGRPGPRISDKEISEAGQIMAARKYQDFIERNGE